MSTRGGPLGATPPFSQGFIDAYVQNPIRIGNHKRERRQDTSWRQRGRRNMGPTRGRGCGRHYQPSVGSRRPRTRFAEYEGNGLDTGGTRCCGLAVWPRPSGLSSLQRAACSMHVCSLSSLYAYKSATCSLRQVGAPVDMTLSNGPILLTSYHFCSFACCFLVIAPPSRLPSACCPGTNTPPTSDAAV